MEDTEDTRRMDAILFVCSRFMCRRMCMYVCMFDVWCCRWMWMLVCDCECVWISAYSDAYFCIECGSLMRMRTIWVRMRTGHGLCACLCEGIPSAKCSACCACTFMCMRFICGCREYACRMCDYSHVCVYPNDRGFAFSCACVGKWGCRGRLYKCACICTRHVCIYLRLRCSGYGYVWLRPWIRVCM